MVARKKILLYAVGMIFFVQGFTQNDSVFSDRQLSLLKLYNANAGKIIHLPGKREAKPYSLFIFISPECPLSQDYMPLLNELNKKYADKISFFGIIPGEAYPADEIRQFSGKYGVQYPLLIDSNMALTKLLFARVTPEVILLNNNNQLIYKGAVNDLLMSLGKRRVKVTSHFLEDAIVESLAGKPASIKRTKAVGCKINDY
jgi:thiol-disulfide isomerase/thioredoxin